MQTCDECDKWKRKTEKLASKYFETLSGMKSEIKHLKRDTATKIRDAQKEVKDQLSNQLKMSLLKIQRKDYVLREELQAFRIERSKNGSIVSHSLNNRSKIIDETIIFTYFDERKKKKCSRNIQYLNTVTKIIASCA